MDTDWLSLDYLTAEYIWEPAASDFKDGKTLHSELRRHLYGEAVERGDYVASMSLRIKEY